MVANMMKNSKTAALDAALSGSRGPVDEIASLLGHAEGFVRRLGALDFRILSAQQRQDCAQVINRVFNAAHAGILTTVAVAEEKHDAAALGARSTAALLTNRVGMSPEQSSRTVFTATTLAAHPEVLAAAVQGQLSPLHTKEIAKGVSAGEAADAAEASALARELLDAAKTLPLSKLRSRVTDITRAASQDGEPEGADPCYVKTRTTRTGMVRLDALLDAEQGAAVREALCAAAGLSAAGDEDDGPGGPPDGGTSGRTPSVPVGPESSRALTVLAEHYLDCEEVSPSDSAEIGKGRAGGLRERREKSEGASGPGRETSPDKAPEQSPERRPDAPSGPDSAGSASSS